MTNIKLGTKFKNRHSKMIAEYRGIEGTLGKKIIHTLAIDGVEQRWTEEDLLNHWVLFDGK